MKNTTTLTLALLALAAPGGRAQSNIDPAHKFAWQESCGWTNWHGAGGTSQGVLIHATFLEGYIWAENVGWIFVGDGTPGGSTAYLNANGSDTGINILVGGDLAGFAWGENVGWINFSTGTLGAQRARFDASTGRLRGFAWGENIGWLNLDDATKHVATACYANCDFSTAQPILNVNDFQCFLNSYAAGNPSANCDGSTTAPALNVNDFQCFLNKYAAGCP